MTRTILVALVLSGLVVGGQAMADFIDGNKLFEQCQRGDNNTSLALCHCYITGVADAFDGSSFCFTTTRVVKEVVDVVILYLRDHPEQRNDDASSLVTTALKEKFPCNQQRTQS